MMLQPAGPISKSNSARYSQYKNRQRCPMLIDSGSDITLIPEGSINQLGITLSPNQRVELEGFDGRGSIADSVELDLVFLGVTFRGRLLVVNSPIGILGRNVLNRFAILLDGPSLNWEHLSDSAK